MSIRDAAQEIVGKTIAGFIVKEGKHPKEQVYLVFDDDTYFEFFAASGG